MRRDLIRVAEALTEMAGVLDHLGAAVQEARAELATFDRIMAEAYMGTAGSEAAEIARLHLERAEHTYHDAERRVRAILWELGDSAPVAPPPEPPLPIVPKPPWWRSVLFGSSGFYAWRRGKDGRLQGFDEDGMLVPAHRGHAGWVELKQGGFGGLWRLIPGIGKRLKVVGPTASLRQLTKTFADDIARCYGWRAAHIDRHIREWYGLREGAPVPAWMKAEFLNKVATAAARSGKVIPGRLGGEATHAVLHFDQVTKRFLVVHFHARGRYAGQFATAFRPTPAQVDALLRQAATVGGS